MKSTGFMFPFEVKRKVPGDDLRIPDKWETVATIRGQEVSMSGAEFVAAQQNNQRHASKMRFWVARSTIDMTSADRLVRKYDGAEYEITSITTTTNGKWLDVNLQRLQSRSATVTG